MRKDFLFHAPNINYQKIVLLPVNGQNAAKRLQGLRFNFDGFGHPSIGVKFQQASGRQKAAEAPIVSDIQDSAARLTCYGSFDNRNSRGIFEFPANVFGTHRVWLHENSFLDFPGAKG
jgi:hypothetical protein